MANLDAFQRHFPSAKEESAELERKRKKTPPLPHSTKKQKSTTTTAAATLTTEEEPKDKARWECLPAADSKWIRGLLDGGPTCTLSKLPCMENEMLMPLEVSNLLLAGRARVEFYAYVTHALLCPRHLLLGTRLHSHAHNDKLAAVCITEDMHFEGRTIQCVRLFTRCFSVKCLEQYQRQSPTSINWVELKPQHHLRYKRLKTADVQEMAAAEAEEEEDDGPPPKNLDT
jgi:hypothetical protein